MKKIILFIFILGCCSLHAQYRSENVFYYYQGEKIFLTERKDKIFIKLDRDVDKKNLLVSIRADKVVRLSTDLKQDETLHDFTVLESKTDNDIPVSVLKQYRTNPGIISAQPLMQYKKTLQGLTDEFVVKLKGNISYTQFQKLVSDNRCIIVEENRFVKNQFLLSVVKESALNALQLANLFYETGLFEFSEPNFVILNAFNSNDTYFSSQWGLKNTGQNGGTSGVDIKAEQAWAIAQGNSNIKVAVIDDGVDLTHPDLQANLLPGYDFSNNNSGGAPVGTTDNHGTACAGIIGAIKDNGKGISGVAPNCKIIPIRFIGGSGLSTDVMANAIHWARQNGADVISNSWGGGSPYSPLENAIFNATTQGRNGKGCVVVFLPEMGTKQPLVILRVCLM